MKHFIQLTINKDHDNLMGLLGKMEANPTDDFEFNEERTVKANKDKEANGLSEFEYFVFTSHKEQMFFSNIYVWVKGNELCVFNIGSEDFRFSELGVERYNLVIQQFFHHYIARFLDASYSGCIRITGEEKTMEKTVGGTIYKKLKAWESLCNKDAPTSNSYDEERWFDFVCSLIENNVELDAPDFGQWLTEDCGWSTAYNDVIVEMELKLEYSISLLKYYGKRHNQ